MPQVTIENPILDSPFREPTRHFRFDEQGITSDIIASRRVSSYFMPIARPPTGQIRSSSTDDIAYWFIDTDYNGESFFVWHAYFTGVDEPYEKLKCALRAEIDESAWQSLYSTTSRPFAPPESGRIEVKVFNHYGDEVLKVFDVMSAAA